MISEFKSATNSGMSLTVNSAVKSTINSDRNVTTNTAFKSANQFTIIATTRPKIELAMQRARETKRRKKRGLNI